MDNYRDAKRQGRYPPLVTDTERGIIVLVFAQYVNGFGEFQF